VRLYRNRAAVWKMIGMTRRRIATVVLAPCAALATWAVARLTVDPVDVVAAALLGALVSWAAAGTLERRSKRPRIVWSGCATSALAISLLAGPSAVASITMHVVTAAVLIVGFAGTLPVRGERA
jgi:hypothetical protein